jgi:hypothetical protein
VSDLITMREAIEIAGSPMRLHAAIRAGLAPREHKPMRFDRREVEATAWPLSCDDQDWLDWEVRRLPNGLMPADEAHLAEHALTPAEAEELQRMLDEGPYACACVGSPPEASLCYCHLREVSMSRALGRDCRWCRKPHEKDGTE